MKNMFKQDDKLCQVEIYNEYLKKIPQLLEQIDVIEKMARKAEIEEGMLADYDRNIISVDKYLTKIELIKAQSTERLVDLREELDLILKLKSQIETELALEL